MSKYQYSAVKYHPEYQIADKNSFDDVWEVHTILEAAGGWVWIVLRREVTDD